MRFYFILLLFSILSLFFAFPTTSSRVPRVVNGILSQPGQWPFMVALYRDANFNLPFFLRKWLPRNLRFFCGAMVWDNQTILTAAHCIKNKVPSQTAVYVGHVDRTVIDESYLLDVEEIIMHARYNDYFVRNDIALLRLVKPINFTRFSQKIAPVPRYWNQLVDPNRCITLGWGQIGLFRGSMHLREADVYLEGCYPQCGHDSGRIRAGDFYANRGVCSGDSGSPLLCALANDAQSYSLVGIASTAFTTCRLGIVMGLATYTYVPNYLEWIEENAGE